MDQSLIPWILFNLLVLALLAVDLGIFHRTAHTVSIREASIWSTVWILLSLLFCFGIYLVWQRVMPASEYSNSEAALSFLTGYLIEKSLSVDNIFVFVLIFSAFAVPPIYQHRVLFWGIIGALVMRAVMIVVGAALLKQFHWIIFVFGAFLVFTGIKMALNKGEEIHPENNPLVKMAKRIVHVTDDYVGAAFIVRRAGTILVTPLLLVLLVVESTDLVFAVDSIPAIFAVTKDPFIVYTSNVFAILGLRSLYFVLAGVVHKFKYLKPALAIILTYVGIKMLLTDLVSISPVLSLAIISGILASAIVLSLLPTRREVPKRS